MNKKNKLCLELYHMTKAEKKAYNKRYYQEHKDYWRDYYLSEKLGPKYPLEYKYSDRSIANIQEVLRQVTNVYGPNSKEANQYREMLKEATAYVNTYTPGHHAYTKRTIGDIIRNNNMVDVSSKTNRRPYASISSSDASKVAKQNKKKRNVQKITNITQSAASAWKSGASDIAKAGKNFLNKLFG